MTDKEKIRKEVERLQKELVKEKEKGFGSDIDDACILELQNVLTYIDSLQEEHVSEDLEEASKKYSSCIYLEEVLSDADKEVLKARLMNTFKAGYKFGKEQAETQIKAQSIAVAHGCPKEPASEGLEEAATKYAQDKHLPIQTWQAFKAGAQWQKEQIIDKACSFLHHYQEYPNHDITTDKLVEAFKMYIEL